MALTEFTCTDCDTHLKADISFVARAIACPSCQRSFSYKEGAGYVIGARLRGRKVGTWLNVGDYGIFGDQKWVVSGIVQKRVYGEYTWDEYVLNNDKGDFQYLSETDGHFILLTEIPDDFTKAKRREIEYDDQTFRLYDRTDAEILAIMGFFDHPVSSGKVSMDEYVNGTQILSFESSNDKRRVYLGNHVSRSAVKKAFSGISLPSKSGIGLVQPFPLEVRTLGLILAVVGIMLCFTHYFIYRTQHEKVVLNSELRFDQYNEKEMVTPSFELEGGSAPMTVSVHSDVDNSWANVTITLVDESNNDEVTASKDVEYYHGYTDGESWTEGSTSDSFNICGVPAGTYHLVVSPMRAPEDPSNQRMSIRATWNSPSTRNLWFTILFMAIACIGAYYAQVHFERRRWADSDYSPFD